MDQRRQQPFSPAIQAREQAVECAASDGAAEVRDRGVLEMVAFVDHEPCVRGQHRGLAPVLLRTAHGEIGEQQVVVHHDHIRLRGGAARLEEEALLEVRALEAAAEIGLGRHLVPHLGARRHRQIAERAVRGAPGPRAQGLDLVEAPLLEHRDRCGHGLLEALQAEIVMPSFQQCEAHGLVAQRFLHERQILPHELFLQVDRVGGDDRALLVRRGPPERGHEIGHRLPHPGARFHERHAAAVVHARDALGHRALAGTVFPRGEQRCHRAAGAERVADHARIEPNGRRGRAGPRPPRRATSHRCR